jgi:hypothetical protein
MPHVDWQFIIVTLIAAAALAVLVWRLTPTRGQQPGKAAPCANCASAEASASTRPKPTRTVTTPVVSLNDLRSTAHQQIKH